MRHVLLAVVLATSAAALPATRPAAPATRPAPTEVRWLGDVAAVVTLVGPDGVRWLGVVGPGDTFPAGTLLVDRGAGAALYVRWGFVLAKSGDGFTVRRAP